MWQARTGDDGSLHRFAQMTESGSEIRVRALARRVASRQPSGTARCAPKEFVKTGSAKRAYLGILQPAFCTRT